MLRKLVCSIFVMVVAIGVAFADELTGQITKVDGNKITFQKTKKAKGKKGKAENDGDPVTYEVAKDAKIIKGKFDMDAKKVVDGDPVEGGLTADIFKNATAEKGVGATITTTDDNKSVTKIRVQGGKKKAAAQD